MPGRPRSVAASVCRLPPLTSGDTLQFIEHLPRTMNALPRWTLRALDDGQGWQVSVTLAPADQAALEAAQPSAYQLCAAAQHALGLAAIGSHIDVARATIVVRARSAAQLAFAGEGALWWVANAPPLLLRACIDELTAQLVWGEAPGQPGAASTDQAPSD
jgi:hypothetical protein